MRTYKINGQEYPSVTSILDIIDKPALKQWAVNCAINQIADKIKAGEEYGVELNYDNILENARTEWKNISVEAMDIGTEIHNLIEVYIKEGRDAVGEMRPEVENGFLAFLDWEQENIAEWMESEMVVYNSVDCYAGTLDAIAKLKNGKIYVLDFKSSKGFYDGYDMQIAGYRHAVTMIKPVFKIQGMGILRLDKETGLPEFKDYSKNYESKLNAFLKLVDFWYAYKKRRVKNKRTGV